MSVSVIVGASRPRFVPEKLMVNAALLEAVRPEPSTFTALMTGVALADVETVIAEGAWRLPPEKVTTGIKLVLDVAGTMTFISDVLMEIIDTLALLILTVSEDGTKPPPEMVKIPPA